MLPTVLGPLLSQDVALLLEALSGVFHLLHWPRVSLLILMRRVEVTDLGAGQEALLRSYITFLDSGQEQDAGSQRSGEAAALGSPHERCVCVLHHAYVNRSLSSLVGFFFSL